MNKLVLIGNGFDLAHGLKTSYSDFLDWYYVKAYKGYCSTQKHQDCLLSISPNESYITLRADEKVNSLKAVMDTLKQSHNHRIKYNSELLNRLVNRLEDYKWVDVEREYFLLLKDIIKSTDTVQIRKEVIKLNKEFDFIISQLTEYIKEINRGISLAERLKLNGPNLDLEKAFQPNRREEQLLVVNFNYTETLSLKSYVPDGQIIYIHGRANDIRNNPIIFGYGDETDSAYQQIEDSGDNIFLEHIKSFGYFRTGNYTRLLGFLSLDEFEVNIVGHSCGLSDRILLNTIFEHRRCRGINIFYHQRSNGSDNFKEITQEISRHFKPQNKGSMRALVRSKSPRNVIPQNF